MASEVIPCVFLCEPTPQRHITPNATEEIKLDSYRAIAVKADGHVNLFSRRRKSFDHHYPLIVEALAELPEGTVVDGEVVALDDSGRPDFNLLQNFRSESQHIHYFISIFWSARTTISPDAADETPPVVEVSSRDQLWPNSYR